MTEVITGVIFSAAFVGAYLLLSKLSVQGRCCAWRSRLEPNAGGFCKSVKARPQKKFMTSGELSEHHSGKERE